jgi:hypothetical protein
MVRAGSRYYEWGGSLHFVTGGFFHENYDSFNRDYDVAVLRVCTDCDIAKDISNM